MSTSRRVVNERVVTTVPEARPIKRISWGAVLAGALVGLMVMTLINLLVLGFTSASINPAQEVNPFDGIGTGTTIGVIVSNLVALFLGGLVAGRLANTVRSFETFLHGILTWGVLTIVSFLLISTVLGRLVSGVTSALGQGLSLAGEGIAAIAPDAAAAVEDALAARGVTLETIANEAQGFLAATGDPALQPGALQTTGQTAVGATQETAAGVAQNPQAADAEIRNLVNTLFAEGQTVNQAANRENLLNALTTRTNLTRPEAEATVQQWEATYAQAQETLTQAEAAARDAGQQAAEAISRAAFWAFGGLLVGAFVAALGALSGKPRDVLDQRAA